MTMISSNETYKHFDKLTIIPIKGSVHYYLNYAFHNSIKKYGIVCNYLLIDRYSSNTGNIVTRAMFTFLLLNIWNIQR